MKPNRTEDQTDLPSILANDQREKNHKAIKNNIPSSQTQFLQCPTYNKNSIRCEKPGKYGSSLEKESIKTDTDITQILTLVGNFIYS